MALEVYGREDYLKRIKVFAESDWVGNQAFLGVKGVGKTSLFQSYFTKDKKKELALNYKKLYVYSQLDSRKNGTDLYQFLLEQVKMGILAIPDAEVRKEIREEMTEINELFETPDGRLNQYLAMIKDKGYDLIMIMDQFHCMARDSEIGKEQYDVLRSYNEQNLITYWIITDTDLMETCATEQYIASFFAQKFTNKMTIGPVRAELCGKIVENFSEWKKVDLDETEKQLIGVISGGIPELISILTDLLPIARRESVSLDEEELSGYLLTNHGCRSLFEGWITGLSPKQKSLVYEVAEAGGTGLHEEELRTETSRMAELSDEVGRGLLHVKKTSGGRIWNINIPLFQRYILECREKFLEEITNMTAVGQKEDRVQAGVPEHMSITNIFHVGGDLIQNQTNNIVHIENAVEGLEDLQRLMNRSPVLLDENEAARKLEYLPFRQEAWGEMDSEEQEAELEKYADGIFDSEIFARGELNEDQKRRFFLTADILSELSDNCRTQIVCGIQVYDLIQMCIDNFGLNMNGSESPRGILFGRAFERHLKDVAAPAYCRIPEFAEQTLFRTNILFKDYPLDKTTIGTYAVMLEHKNSYKILAEASVRLLGRQDRDKNWWKKTASQLTQIGGLRNQCCHSGTTFDYEQLKKLIGLIFEEEVLQGLLLFREIPALREGQFAGALSGRRNPEENRNKIEESRTVGFTRPDIGLIGSRVSFEILEKTARGNFRGIVNGRYEGSLPKSYASKMDYHTVKNTSISVVVNAVQDGKYVLKSN